MSTINELLNTSILVGVLYTLTAPNLAALATLSGIDVLKHRDDDFDDSSSSSSSSSKNKKPRAKTFLLGIEWGIGNSISLMLIGGILIGIQSGDPNEDWIWMDDSLRSMIQAFVGSFLLMLGMYALAKALKNREYNMGTTAEDLSFKKKSRFGEDSISSEGQASEITEIVVNKFHDVEELSFDGSTGSRTRQRGNKDADDSIAGQMAMCLDRSDSQSDVNLQETLGLSEFDMRMWKAAKSLTDNLMLYAEDDYSTSSRDLHASLTTVKTVDMEGDDYLKQLESDYGIDDMPVFTKDSRSRHSKSSGTSSSGRSSAMILKKISKCANCTHCTPGVLAVFVGLVHGLSGPGEVLAVIPAVELKQIHLAVLYIATFCVTSTVIMAGFAAIYGSICRWLVEQAGKKDKDFSQRVFLIEFGSACLSFIVGIVYLTLLAVGELHVITP